MNERFAVIMAGGSGTRFWPRSRTDRPKQLLEMRPGSTLIQDTQARIPAWIDRDHIIYVTNESQAAALIEQTGADPRNVLREPCGKDTAPCVALATALIQQRSAKASMCVLAADHFIAPNEAFAADLERAFKAAEAEPVLVTFGIPAAVPHLGYGYLERSIKRPDGLFEVARFHEKPAADRAQAFVDGGRHDWNSGIFVWSADTIAAEFERQQPALWATVRAAGPQLDGPLRAEAIDRAYQAITAGISVDRGIMQGAGRVVAVSASFEWDDIGSFGALARHAPVDDAGNVTLGETVTLDAKHCVVDNRSEGIVALLGVEGLVVVRVGDAVLVTTTEREQDVKLIVQKLRDQGRDQYL
ncbi:MAG: mannose-1-phosphate guanylyltransferase [Planctomycetes bacterium]|nr:mannose-1-phosphate guanylyltransferase [Planctomycetota bacterium]